MTSATHKSIFDTLINACLAEGGDGDVALIIPDYPYAADRFEDYLKEISDTWWTRDNREGYVTFSNNQECIYVSDADKGFHANLTISSRFDMGMLYS